MKIENVQITDVTTDGFGVGRSNICPKVLFVKDAVMGDFVDVEVFKEEKNFLKCGILKVVKASKYRANPVCEHYDICGGCNLQHISYEGQLELKRNQVLSALRKFAKEERDDINIMPSYKALHYRNKMEYQFADSNSSYFNKSVDISNKGKISLGLHVKNKFDIVLHINKCHLQNDEINDIRNFIYDFTLKNGAKAFNLKYKTGFLRNLIFRTNSKGQIMLIIVFASPPGVFQANLCMALKESFTNLTSILYGVNKKKEDLLEDIKLHVFKGEDFLTETILGVDFKFSAKSFFQSNREVCEVLVNKVLQFGDFKNNMVVYDLYSGIGTFAINVAKISLQVVCIESSKYSVYDAIDNAKINGIENIKFVKGAVEEKLNEDFVAENSLPDCIIVDPTRVGLKEIVCNKLIEISCRKIIYVSCNVATFARDLLILKEKYVLKDIAIFDMFPQTTHVELVALLELV